MTEFTESLKQVWDVESQVNAVTRKTIIGMLEGKTGAAELMVPSEDGTTYKLTIKSARTRKPRTTTTAKKVTKKRRGRKTA